LAKSATSILRQLVDAGTLSNLPAGLKARGLRIKGDDSPLMPGEFRDVDIPGGAIKDNIFPLPYKEPSGVLYQLLGNIVDEGRRIGSVADVDISSANQNAPVGTTLALLERSLKVMSGVQARIHKSFKKELRILSEIIHDHMSAQYEYDLEGEFSRVDDFDKRVDVIPVSDPNAATTSQRIIAYQAALQLAQQAPQLYNLGMLHRQMLETLSIPNAEEIVKLPEDIQPHDPVTENMMMLKQDPVKAFAYQDHEAHIATHMAMMKDPKVRELVGQSPFAKAIEGAMIEHVTEHVAFNWVFLFPQRKLFSLKMWSVSLLHLSLKPLKKCYRRIKRKWLKRKQENNNKIRSLRFNSERSHSRKQSLSTSEIWMWPSYRQTSSTKKRPETSSVTGLPRKSVKKVPAWVSRLRPKKTSLTEKNRSKASS